MLQIAIASPGGPEVLVPEQAPVPEPGPEDLLIRVEAAGVNRPDVLQRQGHYPPPADASPIPGLEVAGRVERVGSAVEGWSSGDPACALVNGGGYAEFCVAPASQCLPIPAGLSAVEAAALPETTFTVWENVFRRGRLVGGEVLLVHGGSGGIGTTAIQLANAAGARVIATAGSAAKYEACRALGAEPINYREADFVEECRRLTGGRGVDVVLDMVGGPYLSRNLEVLAPEGRLVQIAFLQGARAEVDLRAIMTRRLTLTGSTLRSRSTAAKGAIARAVGERVWPWVESRRVRPLIHATFPLADAAGAHRLMESGEHVGKIVLIAAHGPG